MLTQKFNKVVIKTGTVLSLAGILGLAAALTLLSPMHETSGQEASVQQAKAVASLDKPANNGAIINIVAW